jgi:hypothetical protein
MKKTIAFALLGTLSCCAQIVLPEGTKVRVRLDQNISSATAVEGQTVEFSATDAVRVGDSVVIADGARVTGVITQAHEKRRLGRAGKLDFSIDRVRTVDNQWVPLRYTVTTKSGQSHAVRTGVLTAGVAAVFWPAAPVMLLWKGQDVNINRGVTFDVFTDTNHAIGAATAAVGISPGPVAPPPPPAMAAGAAASMPAASATVSITSPSASAEIEVDGVFVGNTPTTLQLSNGQHRIVVKSGTKSWQRTLQISSGSTVSLNAPLQ